MESGYQWLKGPSIHVGRVTTKQKVVTFFSGTKCLQTVILSRTKKVLSMQQYGFWM